MARGARASGERVVSAAGATGPGSIAGTASTAEAADPTKLEMQEGRRQAERRAARLGVPLKKLNGAAPVAPFLVGPGEALPEAVPTGLIAAALEVAKAVEPTNAEPIAEIDALDGMILPHGNNDGRASRAPTAADPITGGSGLNVVGNAMPAEQRGEQRPWSNADKTNQAGTSPTSGAPKTLLGDTDATIEFLQERAATHPLWHPQLSFKRTDPVTGQEAEGFETVSFPRDTNGNPDWNTVRRWIEDRQGRAFIDLTA